METYLRVILRVYLMSVKNAYRNKYTRAAIHFSCLDGRNWSKNWLHAAMFYDIFLTLIRRLFSFTRFKNGIQFTIIINLPWEIVSLCIVFAYTGTVGWVYQNNGKHYILLVWTKWFNWISIGFRFFFFFCLRTTFPPEIITPMNKRQKRFLFFFLRRRRISNLICVLRRQLFYLS